MDCQEFYIPDMTKEELRLTLVIMGLTPVKSPVYDFMYKEMLIGIDNCSNIAIIHTDFREGNIHYTPKEALIRIEQYMEKYDKPRAKTNPNTNGITCKF